MHKTYHRECAFPLTVVFSPADLLCDQPIFGTYTLCPPRLVVPCKLYRRPKRLVFSPQIFSLTSEIGFSPCKLSLWDQRDWFSASRLSLWPARLVFSPQIFFVTTEIGFSTADFSLTIEIVSFCPQIVSVTSEIVSYYWSAPQHDWVNSKEIVCLFPDEDSMSSVFTAPPTLW